MSSTLTSPQLEQLAGHLALSLAAQLLGILALLVVLKVSASRGASP